MRSETLEGDPARPRTFTETARRAQIVAAAIDTIAELGYAQASLARIAERLEISKGVISYHFSSKDDLVREVVAQVLAASVAEMRTRVQAESSGSSKLRAYIQSNVAFMGDYRNHVIAIVEIARTARDADGRRLFDRAVLDQAALELQQVLARFQAAGELRPDFDPAAMALAIRAAIDAVGDRLAREPALDVNHYGRELANVFDHATRPAVTGLNG